MKIISTKPLDCSLLLEETCPILDSLFLVAYEASYTLFSAIASIREGTHNSPETSIPNQYDTIEQS